MIDRYQLKKWIIESSPPPPPLRKLSHRSHVEYDGFPDDQRPEPTHPLQVCLAYNREHETLRQNPKLNYHKISDSFSTDISMPI